MAVLFYASWFKLPSPYKKRVITYFESKVLSISLSDKERMPYLSSDSYKNSLNLSSSKKQYLPAKVSKKKIQKNQKLNNSAIKTDKNYSHLNSNTTSAQDQQKKRVSHSKKIGGSEEIISNIMDLDGKAGLVVLLGPLSFDIQRLKVCGSKCSILMKDKFGEVIKVSFFKKSFYDLLIPKSNRVYVKGRLSVEEDIIYISKVF